jgi:hypothetical protein
MSLNSNISVSFSDAEAFSFLSGTQRQLIDKSKTHPGFAYIGKQANPFPDEIQTVPYMIREIYRVNQRGNPVGIVSAEIIVAEDISFSVQHEVFLKDSLDPALKLRITALIGTYTRQDVQDFKVWLATKIQGALSEEDYVVDSLLEMKKVAPEPREINTEQRDALFKLYGQNPTGDWRARIEPEQNFGDWARNRGTTLQKIDSSPLRPSESTGPDTSMTVKEFESTKEAPTSAKDKLAAVLADIEGRLRGDCGELKSESKKLVTLSKWPEFKIEWRAKTIRIGCVSITINLPIPRIRFSELTAYVRYQMPKSVEQTVWAIVQTCTIRSGLVSAVVGIILLNPAAALAAFQSSFTQCVQQEVVTCVNPGIVVIKVHEGWKDVV